MADSSYSQFFAGQDNMSNIWPKGRYLRRKRYCVPGGAVRAIVIHGNRVASRFRTSTSPRGDGIPASETSKRELTAEAGRSGGGDGSLDTSSTSPELRSPSTSWDIFARRETSWKSGLEMEPASKRDSVTTIWISDIADAPFPPFGSRRPQSRCSEM